MNGLHVHIENYKAIKSADIELADLTVLAGVNASGKSTIARLFHRLVCIEANYERYAAEMVIGDFIRQVIDPLAKAVQSADYRLSRRIKAIELKVFERISKEGSQTKIFSQAVKFLSDAFEDLWLLSSVQDIFTDKRLLEALDRCEGMASSKSELVSEVGVQTWVARSLSQCEDRYKVFASRGEMSSLLFFLKNFSSDFFDPISVVFPTKMQAPVLRFVDGDVPILDTKNIQQQFKPIFTPHQSLYIAKPSVDLPIVSAESVTLNGIKYDRSFQDFKSSNLRIEELMGGILETPQDLDDGVAGDQWLFSFSNNQKIPLSQCADGMKSMASILMLDKCGLLQSDSLLIIDEPEVHLHPQWVVEMARVLVYLAKSRKVRVFVTTHSPDMVHALRDFAENDGLASNTRFYLAKEDEGQKGQFKYESLGMNIGPIFTAFNKAKDKIASISKEIREGAIQ